MISPASRNTPVLTSLSTHCDPAWAHDDPARHWDLLAMVALAIAAIIALGTFRDYGLGWDDYAHSEYGQLLLQLYASGFTDTRALSFVNLYKYGGGFDL